MYKELGNMHYIYSHLNELLAIKYKTINDIHAASISHLMGDCDCDLKKKVNGQLGDRTKINRAETSTKLRGQFGN